MARSATNDFGADRAHLRKAALFAGLLLAASLLAAPAPAQSPRACVDLEAMPVPSVEGHDGMFFRIETDLSMDTGLSRGMVQEIAGLSEVLAARDTRLVFVPLPTRALAMPRLLRPDSAKYGFDPRIARALYADSIAALRSAGVTAVDVVDALERSVHEAPPFFKTDPRMNETGARILANAVADELGETAKGSTRFATTAVAGISLASYWRTILQMHCQAELPETTSMRYVTSAVSEADDAPLPAPVVVAGSARLLAENSNFHGFLSEAMGRRVARQVMAESSLDSLAAYLTSDAYREDRPELIVWLMPVDENLAVFGDQPFRELSAAAADRCTPLAEAVSEDQVFEIALDVARPDAGVALRIETDETAITEATFKFRSHDGAERTRTVIRRQPDLATSRLYMPLSGLWPEGVAAVSVVGDITSATPSFALCRAE